MGKKTLYIRLDSSQMPKVNDRIIVKDFNMESYFCTLLGKRLLETVATSLSIPFPGKIVSDFRNISVKGYNAIIKQWELMLVKLLSENNKEKEFVLNISISFFEWLSHQEDKIYREIGKTQSCCLSFTRETLHKELIESILLKRLEHTLSKMNEAIDCIVIGVRYTLCVDYNGYLGNYIKSLNGQFAKSTIIHRKDFLILHLEWEKTSGFTKYFRMFSDDVTQIVVCR
ncbi:MAG: hypothetical protein Q4Q06_05585 [Bacteroidota bacterium]|nr:hypothetical protein [Bacteroidota bacterium]